MTVVRRFLLVSAILALPGIAYAQEAVLTGTVTDSTGAVLPGVTVTAVLEATGNIFEAVTDSRGTYTIPVRVGLYRIKVELQSFTTVTRAGVQVLAGQTVTINMQMAPGGVAETVTVSAEAPLLNTATSSLGGNIDPRQVAELPAQGRNFMALAMLAPGSKTLTENATTPDTDRGRTGDIRDFQISVDGQQVTRDLGTGDSPKYSQDMIAEFQYIANRFDATQGRSSGLLVNIVTKSGTNTLSGLLRTNYRSDRFNGDEPVLKVKLPISNLQVSTAAGGPLVKDKLHFFGNFEYERQPTETIWNTVYPAFNIKMDGIANLKKGDGRLDYQLTPATRLMGRYGKTTNYSPFGPNADAQHPSSTNTNLEFNDEEYARLTQVLSNKVVNDIEGGRAVYGIVQDSLVTWSNGWAPTGTTNGGPRIRFKTFTFNQNRNLPRHQTQWVYNLKDNFTYSYDLAGRHDLKSGAEFMYRNQIQANLRNATGEIDARGAATPTAAQMQAWFPVWNDASTWCLACLSSIPGLVRTYTIGVGDFNNWVSSKKLAAWAQDDWQVSSRLTLNLGLRYDVAIDAYAQVNIPPWETTGAYNQWGDGFQPRVGFAYKLDDKTVVRGGVGLYQADVSSGAMTQAKGNAQIAIIVVNNTGRTDFAANPFNGQPLPTFDQATSSLFCNANSVKGCLFRSLDGVIPAPKYEPYTHAWQASIGIQRQIGETIGVEADYVYNKAHNETYVTDNSNLTYNPATGVNYPFTDVTHRFNPAWGPVTTQFQAAPSESQELRTSITKRFGNNWQASATYSLRYMWDAEPLPMSGNEQVTFPVALDLGGWWTAAAGEQRHRAVFNGIWQVGRGFQISALQYIGSGIRQRNNYGTDLRDIQGGGGTQLLRPDGTLVQRNSLIGPSQSRTDLRLQQKLPLHGRAKLDGIIEVFNMFNRPNYQIGISENLTTYNQPISGEYRTAQVGFRLTF